MISYYQEEEEIKKQLPCEQQQQQYFFFIIAPINQSITNLIKRIFYLERTWNCGGLETQIISQGTH